jgi:hypothetical protein
VEGNHTKQIDVRYCFKQGKFKFYRRSNTQYSTKIQLVLGKSTILQKKVELMLQKDTIEVITATEEIILPMFTVPKFNNNWKLI